MEMLKVRLSTAADRERNLFIESEQDRKSYEEKAKSRTGLSAADLEAPSA